MTLPRRHFCPLGAKGYFPHLEAGFDGARSRFYRIRLSHSHRLC